MATANVNGVQLFYELHGTGDIPHYTHPDAYVEAIRTFVRKNSP